MASHARRLYGNKHRRAKRKLASLGAQMPTPAAKVWTGPAKAEGQERWLPDDGEGISNHPRVRLGPPTVGAC
jgi:hypothetical protein